MESRIEVIDTKVQSFFISEKQEDLKEDIDEELISEIKVLIDQEEAERMPDELLKRFNASVEQFDQALLMYDIKKKIASVFDDEELVKLDIDIIELKEWLDKSSIKNESFKVSQLKLIKKAEKQLNLVKNGKKAVASLFEKEESVKSDINHEDITKAEDKVSKIKHKNVKAELDGKLDIVKAELQRRETAIKQKETQKLQNEKIAENNKKLKASAQSEEKVQQESEVPAQMPEVSSNEQKINELEEKYYQLEKKKNNLEYQANQYPTHTDEYRMLLSEAIGVLEEMAIIETQLSQLY